MPSFLLEGLGALATLSGVFFWLGFRSRGTKQKKAAATVNYDALPAVRAEIAKVRKEIEELREVCLRGMKRGAELSAALIQEWRAIEQRIADAPQHVHYSGNGNPAPDSETEHSLHRQLREVLGENEQLVHALRDKEESFLRLEEQLHQRLREADEQLSAEHHAVAELERRIDALRDKLDPKFLGPDDIGVIKGIGPKVKRMLEEDFGIKTFRQLATLSSKDASRIADKLPFHDRMTREDWVGQAIELHYRKYSERLTNPLSPRALASVA